MKRLYKTIFAICTIGTLLLSGCSIEPVVVNNYYTNSNNNSVSSESVDSTDESSAAERTESKSVSSVASQAEKNDQQTDSNLIVGINYTVTGTKNYLAIRNAPAFDANNEIAKMKNGDELTIQSQNVYGDNGDYCYVTAVTGTAKGQSGYVNKNYITPSEKKSATSSQQDAQKEVESQNIKIEDPKDYVSMLREYAESGAWKTDCDPGTEIGDPSSCNDLSYNIFDLDGDGVPEMLIYATAPELSGPRIMSASSFCVISNNSVVTIESGSTSGGTIGGTTVGLCEEKSSGRLMIYKSSYTGGFGGNASGYDFYSYSNSSLVNELSTYQVTYFDTSMGSDEYTINGNTSSAEKIASKIGEYEFISDQSISSKITTY